MTEEDKRKYKQLRQERQTAPETEAKQRSYSLNRIAQETALNKAAQETARRYEDAAKQYAQSWWDSQLLNFTSGKTPVSPTEIIGAQWNARRQQRLLETDIESEQGELSELEKQIDALNSRMKEGARKNPMKGAISYNPLTTQSPYAEADETELAELKKRYDDKAQMIQEAAAAQNASRRRQIAQNPTETEATLADVRRQIDALENKPKEYEPFLETYARSPADEAELERLREYEAQLSADVDAARKTAQTQYWESFMPENLDMPEPFSPDWNKYWENAEKIKEFEENSKYESTANGKGAVRNPFNGQTVQTGYDDDLYEYINRNEDVIGAVTANDILTNAALSGQEHSAYGEMTDDEVKLYNYLYKTQGRETAGRYLDNLKSTLNARQRQTVTQPWEDFAKEHEVISSGLSVLMSPLKGVSYVAQAADYLADKKYEPDALYNAPVWANSAIRDTVGGEFDSEAGRFLYNTGLSIADFMFQAALAPNTEAIPLAIMGTGAAADATVEALDRGLSDSQAFALGQIAGAAEIISEKFSLDALLKNVGTKGMKYILKNILVEGTEEVASDVINLTADILIAADKSKFKQDVEKYKTLGKSDSQAFALAVGNQAEEMALDFLGGAISGGVVSGYSAGMNAIAQRGEAGARTNEAGARTNEAEEALREAALDAARRQEEETGESQRLQDAQQLLQDVEQENIRERQETQAQEQTREERSGQEQTREERSGQQTQAQEQTQARESSASEDIQRGEAEPWRYNAEHGRGWPTGRTGGADMRSSLGEAGQEVFDRFDSTLTEEDRDSNRADKAMDDLVTYYNAGAAMGADGDISTVRTDGARLISETWAREAYDAGVRDSEAAAQADIKGGFKTAGASAGLIENEHTQNLNREQRRSLDRVGKRVGAKIEIVKNLDEGRSEGMYPRGGDTIYIDADNFNRLGMGYAYKVVVVHEVTHRMRETAPNAWRKMRNLVARSDMQTMTEGGGRQSDAHIRTIIEGENAIDGEQSTTTEDALDERTAMRIAELQGENGVDLFAEIAREDRQTARTIADIFRDVINALKEFFTGNAGEKAVSELEQLHSLFEEALAETDRNIREAEKGNKNTAQNEGGRNMRSTVKTSETGFVKDENFERNVDRLSELKAGSKVRVGRILKDSPLNKVGIPAGSVYFDVTKMQKILNDHNDHLTDTDLKRIPEILGDPVLITEYVAKGEVVANTVSIYGDFFISTDKGKVPVVTGLVVTAGRGGKNTVGMVRTMHARGDYFKKINDNTILYLTEDKNRARMWFACLQHPIVLSGGTKPGLNRRITLELGSVNTQSQKNFKAESTTEENGNKNTAQNEGGRNMRLTKRDANGNLYVEVRTNMPANVKFRTVTRAALSAMNKFEGGIDVADEHIKHIKVNAQSRNEVVNSDYSNELRKEAPQKYIVKMKALTHLDEILNATENWKESDLDHDRKDNFEKFVKGRVTMDIDGVKYSARVVVGITRGGNNVFYDLTRIKELIKNKPNNQRRQQKNTGRVKTSARNADILSRDAKSRHSLRAEAQAIPSSDKNTLSHREEKSNSQNAQRHSRKSVTEDAKRVLELEKENKRLKTRIANLSKQLKLSSNREIAERRALDAARRIKKAMGSDIDADYLKDKLTELYEIYDTTQDPSDPRAEKLVQQIANEVVSEITEDVGTDYYEDMKDMLDDVRGTTFYLDEGLAEEVRSAYNSVKEFNQRYFGWFNVTLTDSKDAVHVDDFFRSLSEKAPGIFPGDVNEAEQLFSIAELVDRARAAKNQRVNIYDGNTSAEAWAEARQYAYECILDSYMITPRSRYTRVDRIEEKYRRQRDEDRRRYEAEVDALRAKFNERLGRTKEQERKAQLRGKIIRLASRMETKLKNPKDKPYKHVPDEFQEIVKLVLGAINPSAESLSRKDALEKLQAEYRKIYEDAENGGKLARVIDPELLGYDGMDSEGNVCSLDALIRMTEVTEDNGKTREKTIAEMDTWELETVYNVLQSIEGSMRKMDDLSNGALLSDMPYDRVEKAVGAILEVSRNRKARRESAYSRARGKAFTLEYENPYTFFSHFGEPGLEIFNALRAGQRRSVEIYTRLKGEMRGIVKAQEVREIEGKVEQFANLGPQGHGLTLTHAHIMELYLLNKREQARRHLYGGNIDENGDVNGGGELGGVIQPRIKTKEYNIQKGEFAIPLTPDDVKLITDTLTPREKQIADALQEICAGELAEYGNEASLRAFGYRKFTDPDYWSIHTFSRSVEKGAVSEANAYRSIQSLGMTKNVNIEATNALELSGVFDTFLSHAKDMSDYAALMCPIMDAQRIKSLATATEVKTFGVNTIDALAGRGASDYWNDLLVYLQNRNANAGGAMLESEKLINALIGRASATAVGLNLRVAMQQPTAWFRAAALLSPRDMTEGLTHGATPGDGWTKALKYSPTAMQKEQGGFDMGGAAAQKADFYNAPAPRDRMQNAAMWLPARADAATWGRLWNACELQTARERPEIELGSDEFYAAVDELFTSVVDQTQVMDGILQRPPVMRSTSSYMKELTRFMGEPIMTLNMLARAANSYGAAKTDGEKSAAARTLRRTVEAVVMSSVVNAVVKSVADAWRDDDEDKDFWEKYMSALTGIKGDESGAIAKAKAILGGNLGDELNYLTNIPGLNALFSIFQGHRENGNLAISTATEVYSAVTGFAKSLMGENDKTVAYSLNKLTASAAKLLGIPAGNLERDAWGIIRSAIQATGNTRLEYAAESAIYKLSSSKNNSRYYKIMLHALEQGDIESYDYIRNKLMQDGKTASGGKLTGDVIDRQVGAQYDKERAADPSYKISEIAENHIGWREKKAAAKTETEDTFGADDLDAAQYAEYANERAGRIADAKESLRKHPIFTGMDEETQDKVLEAAYATIDARELSELGGDGYEPPSKWVGYMLDAPAGIDEWEYALFHVAEQSIKGEDRQERVRDMLDGFTGLTGSEKSWLWNTLYKGEY